MNSKKVFLFISLSTTILLIIKLIQIKSNNVYMRPIFNKSCVTIFSEIVNENKECTDYIRKCNKLFLRLRYPNQSLIIRPPLRMPPAEMMNRFTQNGDMPITKQFYFNEVYSDSNSNKKNVQGKVSANKFYELVKQVEENKPIGQYDDSSLSLIMKKYLNKIKCKSLVVIGTQIPWVEAIAYHLSVSRITTLDYTRKQYEVDDL